MLTPRTRLAITALVLAAACRSGDAPAPAPAPAAPAENPPARKALLFGFTPAHGAREAAAWGARLAAYLSARTGLAARPFVASSYGTLVRGMTQDRVDLAWVPPLVYVTAARGDHARAIVKFVRHGRGDYHSAFIVHARSSLRALPDLQGKRMAWIDPRSSAGYLFPRAHLLKSGVNPDRFFSHQAYLGSHRRVVEAILDGRADVGVTFFSPGPSGEVIISAWHQYYPARAGEIRVVGRVGPIPSDVIAVRSGMAPDARRKIRDVFVRMHEDTEGRQLLMGVFNAERAVPARHGDYASVAELAQTLRLE